MRVKGVVTSLLAATLIAVLATMTAAADTSVLAAGTVAETGSLASSDTKKLNKEIKKFNSQEANLSKVWSTCPKKFTPTSSHTCSSTLPSCAYGTWCGEADSCVRRKQCSCDDSGKFSCILHPTCPPCLNKPTKAPTAFTKKLKKGSRAALKADLSKKWKTCPKFTPTSNHSCDKVEMGRAYCVYGGLCGETIHACSHRTWCVCDDTGKFACTTKDICKPCEA